MDKRSIVRHIVSEPNVCTRDWAESVTTEQYSSGEILGQASTSRITRIDGDRDRIFLNGRESQTTTAICESMLVIRNQ